MVGVIRACRWYAARQLPEHEYADEALSGFGVEHRPAYRCLLAARAGTPPGRRTALSASGRRRARRARPA